MMDYDSSAWLPCRDCGVVVEIEPSDLEGCPEIPVLCQDCYDRIYEEYNSY